MVRRKPIWVIMIATYYIQIHIAVLQHSIQYTQIVSVGKRGFETYAEIADLYYVAVTQFIVFT
jgi:hypothetical protein